MDTTSAGDPGHRQRWIGTDRVEAHVLLNEVRYRMFGRLCTARVGRFELRKQLGRGAHGAVYLADDPQLGRQVAVKVLARPGSEDPYNARLLREAHALARLKHPNVLTVYDAGVEGDRVFIAMEFVEGGTLKDWCRANPPGTRARFDELVELAIAMGRGLAAAHDAGITHRDIKPANILVGSDGRPRIADFGVAHTSASSRGSLGEERHGDATTTIEGTLVGTPAFMAPEQFDGQPSPASDQWGLCVTLWEAAYGERPFVGERLAELAVAVLESPRSPPVARSEVPSWWRDILLRGLRRNAADRWPSIDALVAQLEQAATRRRRRRLAIGLGGIALAGAAALVAHQVVLAQRRSRCEQTAAEISALWNEDARRELGEAFAATGLAFAELSAAHTTPHVDEYAQRWQDEYARLCVATEVDGTRDRASWAAAARCLDDRRTTLEVLLEVLGRQPDVAAVERSVDAVTRLPSIERCGDEAWLARHFAAPGNADGEARRRDLLRAQALEAAGAIDRGRTLADELVRASAEPVDARLRAQILLTAGRLASAAGAPGDAREQLEQAMDGALGAGEDELALQIATELVTVVGAELVEHDRAEIWAQVADGLLARVGETDGLDAARLHQSLGRLHDSQGQYPAAAQDHTAALQILERVLGPDHPDVAAALNRLGGVLSSQGHYDEAEDAFLRALAIDQQALGADHPRIADSHQNLGGIYKLQGRIEPAEQQQLRALEIRRNALGPDHLSVAQSLSSLGILYKRLDRADEAMAAHRQALEIVTRALGDQHVEVASVHSRIGGLQLERSDYEQAERSFGAALKIFEAALGPEHPHVGRTRVNLGTVYMHQGRVDEAERAFTEALPAVEAALGPEHPHTAGLHHNLGVVRHEQGRFEEARQAFVRAAEIREKTLGADSMEFAESLGVLARSLTKLGRHAEAVQSAERALAIMSAADVAPSDVAVAQYQLARSLSATGDCARAMELTDTALATLRDAGENRAELYELVSGFRAANECTRRGAALTDGSSG